ncbi:MAG: malonyl CoA-acyl carrier protein transacylase [Phycisphaeraceae bacterium]|nr:MAG: malonyl CoA-acyl carrier protein transacylase [Phycisphaeraceae bacterium]
MTNPIVILCPGQGAQAVGMAKAWCETSAAARGVFDVADELLGAVWRELGVDLAGTKLSSLCFDGPAEVLNRTDVCQPAIFAASVASWRGWLETTGLGEADASVEAAAGLSLGEYTALHIAGALSFVDGLRLVALRGRAMQEAAEAVGSGMVALIGADEESANAVCDAARGSDVLVSANFNAPGQVVISGSASACDRAEAVAGEHGVRATRLQVAGAFHSPIMAPAAERLGEALAAAEVRMPRCTVMSNVTAEPHQSPEGIRRGLFDQLTSPVRWAACCEWLVNDTPDAAFHELAPGKTLGGMMRRINRGVKVAGHDGPDTP